MKQIKNNSTLPRGMRNCNPGNIRQSSVTYKGEVKPSQDPSFKQFTDMVFGYRAMFMLLRSYIVRRVDTIRLIIARYAPATENFTQKYIADVARMTRIDPDTAINPDSREQMTALVSAISFVENGLQAPAEDVEAGWNLYCQR